MAVTVVECLSLLRPWDVDKTKMRFGPKSDGGYVFLPALMSEREPILSYGIDGEYRLEIELGRRGHEVFMFDHTIVGVDIDQPNLSFVREGVAAIPDPLLPTNTVEAHLDRYAPNAQDAILKMDVEGCEYSVLDAMPLPVLRSFKQIVIELHDLHHFGRPEFRTDFHRIMTKLVSNFTLFHVHANNFDGEFYGNVEGHPVPNLLELSFARNDLVMRRPSRTLYPTHLDHPCVGPLDKKLWFFPFLPTCLEHDDFVQAESRMRMQAELALRG